MTQKESHFVQQFLKEILSDAPNEDILDLCKTLYAYERNLPRSETQQQILQILLEHHVEIIKGLGIEDSEMEVMFDEATTRLEASTDGIVKENIRQGNEDGMISDFAYVEETERIVTKDKDLGLCFSGGGMRAFIVTASCLNLLRDSISDVGYISAISGSTWALADWMVNDTAFHDKDGNFVIPEAHESYFSKKTDIIKNAFVGRDHSTMTNYFLTVTDFFASVLHSRIPIDLDYSLSNMQSNARGVVPIFVATVSDLDDAQSKYIEFTPNVIGNQLDGYISAHSMAIPLFKLLGIWGSAFCEDEHKIKMIMKKKDGRLWKFLKLILWKDSNKPLPGTAIRIKNFFQSPSQEMFLRDGGIICNIPLVSLLGNNDTIKSRNVRKAIVFDSSGGENMTDEFFTSLLEVFGEENYNTLLSDYPLTRTATFKIIHFNNRTIFYIPFDLSSGLISGIYATVYLDYTTEQITDLIHYSTNILTKYLPLIKSFSATENCVIEHPLDPFQHQ